MLEQLFCCGSAVSCSTAFIFRFAVHTAEIRSRRICATISVTFRSWLDCKSVLGYCFISTILLPCNNLKTNKMKR